MVTATDRRMLTLALSSYAGFEHTDPGQVRTELEQALTALAPSVGPQQLVWGPALHKPGAAVFDAAAVFVVRSSATPPSEVTVVVRGTSPASLWSWVHEDLDVGTLVPWSGGGAGPGAKISRATATGLAILLGLTPAAGLLGAGTGLVPFLGQLLASSGGTVKLSVTGHSLGAALASTLALQLKFALAPAAADLGVWTFAGPSAGNKAFAVASNAAFGSRCNRFANTLDVTPCLWTADGFARLPDIYPPLFLDLPAALVAMAHYRQVTTGKGYTQIGQYRRLRGSLQPLAPTWFMQWLYQHVFGYLRACGLGPEVVEQVGLGRPVHGPIGELLELLLEL